MNTDMYIAIYNYLVFDRYMDTDEARCILSDIEDEMLDTDALDAWDYLEEIL